MAAPPNDDFANAIVLTGERGTQGPVDITDATTQVGEPDGTEGPSPAEQTIWYTYTPATDGQLRVAVSPGDWEPVITIWTGATLGTLVEVGAEDNPFVDPTVLTVPVDSGTTYRIQIGTWGDVSQSWTITWQFSPDDPHGIAVAFDSGTMQVDPFWTVLDDVTQTGWRVNDFTIDRGRSSELDRTDTGRATIRLSDLDGSFDPSNTSGPFFGLLDPMKQVAIRFQNPVTEEWRYLFRGFISEWPVDVYKTGFLGQSELECVDLFGLLNTLEMVPGTHGNTPPEVIVGDIFFAETSTSDQVRERLTLAADQAGIPDEWRHFFSGNVHLQACQYAPRESLLTVFQDAADAEFPGVANILMSRRGTLVFRGRYARFDPNSYVTLDDDDLRTGLSGVGGRLVTTWKCGGRAQCDADQDVALINEFSWRRSEHDIINAAAASPRAPGDDQDYATLLYKDDDSIDTFGWRSSPPMDDLIVLEGNTPPGQSAVEECRFFSEFYVENYKEPKTRITRLEFRGLPLADHAASATWALICGVEIGDVLHVEADLWGGPGGFDEDYFIEGIRYECHPAAGPPDMAMSLDVSPTTFYAHNPWGTAVPPDA